MFVCQIFGVYVTCGCAVELVKTFRKLFSDYNLLGVLDIRSIYFAAENAFDFFFLDAD